MDPDVGAYGSFDDGRAERKPGFGFAEQPWVEAHWNVFSDPSSRKETGDMDPRGWIGLGSTAPVPTPPPTSSAPVPLPATTSPPSSSPTIGGTSGPTQTLFFTEVADPKDSYQSRYVEFYSPDSAGQVIGQVDGNDLYLGRAVNTDSDYTKNKNILTGATIGADGFFIVCYSLTDFTTSYPGKTCDLESSNVNSNGDDAYVVCILFYILCFVMSMDMYIS